MNEFYKKVEAAKYKLHKIKVSDNEYKIIITDSRNMGRFICEIITNQEKVLEAKYIYND
ncbi:MAG: hypothetical protein HQK78_11320 [Desulfobacterales bacterium]|nr:hypothetical protein [Desulfobacterales bacterium]